MKITSISATAEGVTFFRDLEIPLESAGAIGRLSETRPGVGVIFRETDDTYDYDWHPAPRNQWLFLLDGEIEIETGDGATRRFRGGDVLLLQDAGSPRGHRTRQLSAGVRRSVFIPLSN